MIYQTDLGPTPFSRLRRLAWLIQTGAVTVGGNRPGKLYGRLNCRAGKRMNERNRVFFRDHIEAVDAGFRPCAVCLTEAYREWKANRKEHP